MTRVREVQQRDNTAERRRNKILGSAEQLLATHGYDGLRLRDVAADAGVSIGMIQHYFVTRDDLLRETISSAGARRVATWEELGTRDDHAARQLYALLEGAISDRHRCIVWVETCAAATRHPELRGEVLRTQAAWHAGLRRVIEAGIDRGELESQRPVADTVDILVNLIDGLMLEVATAESEEPVALGKARLLREAGAQLLGLKTSEDLA